MPVTLAQASLNAENDVDRLVIDEFRKSSWLFDNLVFHDAVNPAGGGATLVYGYQRLITEAGAAFRAINAEYTPSEATKQEYTVSLKPFGGSYQIDRTLAAIARAREIAFQQSQKVKSARALFNDAFINGDTGANPDAFDGLDVALTGTSTEYKPLDNGEATGYIDWTSIATQADAFAAMGWLDALLGLLDGPASAILTNSKAKLKIQQLARWAGYRTEAEDSFGRKIAAFDDVPIIDLGEKPASSNPVIPIETRDADEGGAGGNITGLTDIYAVRLGMDGVHGVSLAGVAPVQQWLPDFSTSGAVKTGEVEMTASIAVKATKSAAVLRNVKVQ